jgi:hypothetical protein
MNATLTDIDGKYSLQVPQTANTLVFTYVGMSTVEKALGASNVVDVTMVSEAKVIEGVVVTALGISREKKSLGYSVQDVKGADIAKAREANIINSLSGKVSGVQITNASGAVGSSARIVIRGANSLKTNSQPLFIVDGIPMSNREFSGDGTDGVNRVTGLPTSTLMIYRIHLRTERPQCCSSLWFTCCKRRGPYHYQIGIPQCFKSRKRPGVELSNSTTFERPSVSPIIRIHTDKAQPASSPMSTAPTAA